MTSNVPEKILASKMLSSVADHTATQLASFSGWLITGFAAAFGLLLANLTALSQYLEPGKFGKAIILFMIAVVAHVIQRWLAAITAGSIAAGKEASDASAGGPHEIAFDIVFAEMERASYRPMRWLLRRSFEKLASGDLAAAGRMQFKMAQWQAFMVLAQLVMSVSALVVIAVNLQM